MKIGDTALNIKTNIKGFIFHKGSYAYTIFLKHSNNKIDRTLIDSLIYSRIVLIEKYYTFNKCIIT